MTATLCATGLTHQIDGMASPILKDVNIVVQPGEFISIQGRSGSGKTTLLSILGLLLRPQTGALSIGDVATGELTDTERATARRSHLGFVFQNYSLIASHSAWENVSLPLMSSRSVPARKHREMAQSALAELGLGDRTDAAPAHLSGGEQQRVAIARALVTQPKLVLADEPTGALDVETGEAVLQMLVDRVRAAQTSLVLVTHDPEIARRADTRYLLHDGELLRDTSN